MPLAIGHAFVRCAHRFVTLPAASADEMVVDDFVEARGGAIGYVPISMAEKKVDGVVGPCVRFM
jgi:hypothetical protein